VGGGIVPWNFPWFGAVEGGAGALLAANAGAEAIRRVRRMTTLKIRGAGAGSFSAAAGRTQRGERR